MKRKWFFTSLMLLLIGGLLLSRRALATSGYELNWDSVAGGGGMDGQGGSFGLGDSLGQPDAGPSNPGTFAILGGFWAGATENADLSALVFSTGSLSPAFDPATVSYTQSVAHPVSSLTVTPSVADPAATVTVNGMAVAPGSASGPIGLNVGPNTVTTVVTAQDGFTTKTYTVTVTRAALPNEADLSALVFSTGPLSPAFDPGTLNYTQSVGQANIWLTITPTAADPSARITVNGRKVASGHASIPIHLSMGPNAVTIVVLAQDGVTTKTYTVIVTRRYKVFLPIVFR